MPRRSGEDGPLRAIGRRGRYTSQALAKRRTHSTVVGDALLGTGPVEGPDTNSVANRTVDIGHVRASVSFIHLADFAFDILFVFVMPHVLRLGGRALMRAVRSDR